MNAAEHGIPVTRRIVQDIESQIVCGELAGGTRLPSVRELALRYDISTAVTLAAYRTLEKKGLVERRAGSGTFVSGQPENRNDSFFGWSCVLPEPDTEALIGKVAPSLQYCSFPAATYTYNAQFLSWICGRNRGEEKNPGLVAVNDGQLPCLALEKALLPLDDFLDRSELLSRAKMPDELLKALSWNGKLYALPVAYGPTMLFFNRRLFRKAGLAFPTPDWNWQDLYEHTRQLTQWDEGRVSRYGLAVLFTTNSYTAFVFQNGAELFDRNGNCVMSREDTYEALRFFSELFLLPGCCSHHRLGESRAGLAELMNHDLTAMVIGDANDYLLLCERMPREDWGMVRLPGRNNHRTSLSIRAIGLTAGGRSAERFRILEQLFCSPLYPEYCRRTYMFPGYDPVGEKVPEFFLDILKEAAPPRLCVSPNATNALEETIEMVFAHKLPLTREQCADFERKINARL